jgi:hypothetical protein
MSSVLFVLLCKISVMKQMTFYIHCTIHCKQKSAHAEAQTDCFEIDMQAITLLPEEKRLCEPRTATEQWNR